MVQCTLVVQSIGDCALMKHCWAEWRSGKRAGSVLVQFDFRTSMPCTLRLNALNRSAIQVLSGAFEAKHSIEQQRASIATVL